MYRLISSVLQVLGNCEDLNVKTFLASPVTQAAYVGGGRPFFTQLEGHCVHRFSKRECTLENKL